MTLDEALLLAQDVPDIRLVLIADFSNGADVIMQGNGALHCLTSEEFGATHSND